MLYVMFDNSDAKGEKKQRKGLRNGEGAALEKAVRDCLTEKVAFG